MAKSALLPHCDHSNSPASAAGPAPVGVVDPGAAPPQAARSTPSAPLPPASSSRRVQVGRDLGRLPLAALVCRPAPTCEATNIVPIMVAPLPLGSRERRHSAYVPTEVVALYEYDTTA